MKNRDLPRRRHSRQPKKTKTKSHSIIIIHKQAGRSALTHADVCDVLTTTGGISAVSFRSYYTHDIRVYDLLL